MYLFYKNKNNDFCGLIKLLLAETTVLITSAHLHLVF
jgi:hypothetical protein